jgi:hypothetical protein
MNTDPDGAAADSGLHLASESDGSVDRSQGLRMAVATTNLIQRGLDAHVQVMVPGEWRRRGEPAAVQEPVK